VKQQGGGSDNSTLEGDWNNKMKCEKKKGNKA
jgi:hypothetical protein